MKKSKKDMPINVMINGQGKMGTLLAKCVTSKIALKDEDLKLVPFSLAREGKEGTAFDNYVQVVSPAIRETLMPHIKILNPGCIAIDVTNPEAVNDNAAFYCKHGIPFVMATTGGNRTLLEEQVRASRTCAVIAPNLAAPIVSLQAFFSTFARENPGSMRGYKLKITESHQGPDPARPEFKGKADPSGTAIKLSESFGKLGIEGCPYDAQAIMANPRAYENTFVMIRDRETQLRMGIPAEHLDGHGWHRYTFIAPSPDEADARHLLQSELKLWFFTNNPALKGYKIDEEDLKMTATAPNGNVLIEMYDDGDTELTVRHNINGRAVYVDGAFEAVRFLKRRIYTGEQGKVFSMDDVAKNA